MEEELKQGDVVALKSGGPPMTIEWIDRSTRTCSWFDGTARLKGEFSLKALQLAEPEKK